MQWAYHGAPKAIPSADPVPQTEHIRNVDPEFGYRRRKVLGNATGIVILFGKQPRLGGAGIRHRLLHCEPMIHIYVYIYM